MQKERARERIIMFLCFISLLLTPVLATSQSTAMRVSLNLKSATVKEFFDAVKVQTGLNFIYNTEQVKNMPHITVRSSSQPVNEVLDKVLANTGCTYEIEGNIVTVVYQQPKEKTRTATGVVVDEDGLPLPGAYIKLAKTDHSTIAGWKILNQLVATERSGIADFLSGYDDGRSKSRRRQTFESGDEIGRKVDR